MDCDYCQGIGPNHVRLGRGLSYSIRPKCPGWTQSTSFSFFISIMQIIVSIMYAIIMQGP